MKKVYIKTYGCQMNEYDTTRMADLMSHHGYERVDTPDDAHLMILNTCHIREKASEKVYSDLGRLKKIKDKLIENGEEAFVAVAGCVGQAEGGEIMKRAPMVDMVFGPQTYHRLPEFVAKAQGGVKKILDTDFPVEEKFDFLPETQNTKGYAAFLSVQEGCDKFCTFCVVPYTRGAEYSRKVKDVLKEAHLLVGQGIREITLLGQNVNAYHGENEDGKTWSLARLIAELAEIDGLERIRYTTSHPKDMSDDLIDVHASINKLMPYLHLPVQSGSNEILKAMNRHHTAEDYINIIEKMRKARPDLALSGDFIVGFPGETDKDFEDTLNLIKTVNYASSFSFKYSPRPGTPAVGLRKHIAESVKSERLSLLQALLYEQQTDFNRSMIGKTLPVLAEKIGRHEGQIVGKSPYLQPVHFIAPNTILGKIVHVRITQIMSNSLTGEIVHPSVIRTHHYKEVAEHAHSVP